ncbi:hypothetical protein BGW38_004708 [Lunasporangiospora selenospora]|uniref:Nucleolar pre-ribosomal-associated protein 1 n=1 Tax=Lunasporangiospora selenospora TaxID=979761 RepID=A0A9P6KIR8_9FUNG|nr:hypothetical protein BGW38_004708 [Lunasporangiospora selenospora]
MEEYAQRATPEKALYFAESKDIVKALDTTHVDLLSTGLKRLRQQLNVRPNSKDPQESALATKCLATIYAYVEESPECTQLFKIWEWQQQNAVAKVEVPILEVLSKLIHQCNTALHRSNAIKLTRSILQNHMTVIYRHLSSGRPNTVHATLRLLAAMNHVHHTTTRELKDEFNFGLKVLTKIRNQRHKEGENEPTSKSGRSPVPVDARTLYTQFLLAFFIRGDATVKKEVLEIPDLFQKSLSSLHLDSAPLIKQVLDVILNNIVMDNDLPRSSKISFLSTSFLSGLLRLYGRTEVEAPLEKSVAQLVHEFIMAISTTPGIGICFQDAAWYPPSTLTATATSERQAGEGAKHIFNKTLSQLLTHLRPTEDLLQQKLTIAILTACPELVRPYWQKASVQLEPRLSARWLANMTLLHKITEIPVPNLYLQHTSLFASHPPPIATIIENILPTPATRTILSKGLQHSSMLVRYFTVVELAAVFQKAEQVIAVMQTAVESLMSDEDELSVTRDAMDVDESLAGASTNDAPAHKWAEAIVQLLAELRRRVPDIQIIIQLYNGIQSSATSTDMEDEEKHRLDLFNNGALRLIKYYQQFLPHAISESKFDIGKLIPSDFSAIQPGTLVHLLEMLLAFNDFRWSNKSQDGSSYLVKLLKLFLTTSHPNIRTLTQRLLSKLLGESILFQHDSSEADLWIEAIPTTSYRHQIITSDQESLLQFLDDCVARCLKTPYKYVDQSLTVLKRLQDANVTMEPIDQKDPLSALSSSVALSQHQNLAQHYSPLLMTILEQFQYIYAKDSSKQAACATAAFLSRLLPMLACNHNRSSALAIECLNRIQDPAVEEQKAVQSLSLKERLQIGKFEVKEYLAITRARLEHDSITDSGITEVAKSKNNVSVGDLLQGDNTLFATALRNQTATAFIKNFKEIVQYAQQINSIAHVVDYIQARSPFALPLFSIKEIAVALEKQHSHDSKNRSPVVQVLDSLPFHVLFPNISPSMLARPSYQKLLKDSVERSTLGLLPLYSRLVISRLVSWIGSGEMDTKSTKACFELLAYMLGACQQQDGLFTEFKSQLWESYGLREIYLFRATEDPSNLFNSKGLDSSIVGLLSATTKTLSAAPKHRQELLRLTAASFFVRKTVEQVLHELEKIKRVGVQALQFKTVQHYSELATMCSASDFTIILQTLLNLHRLPGFSTTPAFNTLLSTTLKRLSAMHDSANVIPTESTSALLDLWKEQPSDDLDDIVLGVISGRLWPNAMANTIEPLDLSVPGIFDQAQDSLRNPSLSDLDLSLVDFVLGNSAPKRYLILASLVTASADFRGRLTEKILAMSESEVEARLEEADFITLLHAFMNRMAFFDGMQYQWSSSATEVDHHAVPSLRPQLLSVLVKNVGKSSFCSKTTIMLSDIVAIITALAVQPEDEDDVNHVWVLLENLPRTGLDTVCMAESLIERTKNLVDEQALLERHDRISRWFEKTARLLINVLDIHGEVEWLAPVSKRLAKILETHVEERKLNIDQKILFELVSFAIEKAVDNVELVHFSACLAQKYYTESSQGSVLPQILQTLFKNKYFSSSVMATAPSNKYTIPENYKSRLAIIHLIYTLTSLEPHSCCKAGFLPTLLSCYSASTSVADQLLLSVLRITESQTAGSISGRAPIWGSGVENVKSSKSLFGQAMISESMDLIDPSMMMTSAIHFPQDRPLETEAPRVTLKDYNDDILKLDSMPIYDPSFMLPLFATLMSFGNQLDCRRLIEVNGLGMIVAALSSNDEQMRLAAYSLMDEFYVMLSHATMREKSQLQLLLGTFKNSIVGREETVAPRVPAAITSLVIHALATILRPDHFMYPHVNKFCLQRPTIDFEDIPMFYSLFNSSSDHHRKERVWLLRLLAASTKSTEDYKLFKRRHIIDLLVAFFNSHLSEPLSKKIVIEVLFNTVSLPKTSLQLVTQSAFLSWLHTFAAINVMSMENEFSLVPARLLLRTVQACPKESVRWMNGVWKNQVAGIASTLLRQMSAVKVNSGNIAWALTSLESIIQLFSYLLSFGNESVDNGMNESFFNRLCVRQLLMTLHSCEQAMVIPVDQCPVPIPTISSRVLRDHCPSRSDPLDLLYRVDPIPVHSHSRIVCLALELVMKCSSPVTPEEKNAILSRALCYRIVEAMEMARSTESSA